jgi:anthranilate/para-aminobenzoate synthase component II
VFGICMGHQVLGQAFGGKTFKLKFGHHGGNHPIRHNPTGALCRGRARFAGRWPPPPPLPPPPAASP